MCDAQVRRVLKVSADPLVTSAHPDFQVHLVIQALLDQVEIQAAWVPQDRREVAVLLDCKDCKEPQDSPEHQDL